MFAMNKSHVLALFITIVPAVSICTAPGNKPKTSHLKETVMDYIPQIKDFCNAVSEKCQPLYNPLSLGTIAITSAALGLRNIGFLLIGGFVIANAEQITEFVKEYTESLEKPVLPAQATQTTENPDKSSLSLDA